MGILTCMSIADCCCAFACVCASSTVCLCKSISAPRDRHRVASDQSRRLYGLIVNTVAHVQFLLSLQASNPLKKDLQFKFCCQIKFFFFSTVPPPLNPVPRLDMKQCYVKKKKKNKKKRVALHKRVYQKMVWGQIQGGRGAGWGGGNKRKTLPFALLSNFFFPIQFPLSKAGVDLSNIAANLTSKDCRHVNTLFNCDKEYAFMLKLTRRRSSGQSPQIQRTFFTGN